MPTPTDTFERRLHAEVARLCTVVRQSSFLTATTMALLQPAVRDLPATRLLCLGLAVWAIYRLATRSPSRTAILGDLAWTAAISAALPFLALTHEVTQSGSVPQAIAGVSLASFGVQLRLRWSAAALLAGMGAYAVGITAAVGWTGGGPAAALFPIASGWLVALALRKNVRWVASTADEAHRDRLAAEIANGIAEARRKADREQLALLHDTAAATLLLVAQEPGAPVERLAAQATRDLALLEATPLDDPAAPVDVVALVREEAGYLDLPVAFTGLAELWLDGTLARTLAAAAREALTNVDRHAGASSVTISAGPHRLEISDDGRGFVAGAARRHGISESLVARMRRIGGQADVLSVPGYGTSVHLRWQDGSAAADPATSSDENEALVRGVTASYSLALSAAGIVLLGIGIIGGPVGGDSPRLDLGLAVAAVFCASVAASARLRDGRWTVWVMTTALIGLSAGLQAMLADSELRMQATWCIGVIGFCLLPFLIRLPAARGVAILVAAWAVPAVLVQCRDHSLLTFVHLGTAAAAFLVPQVAACAFSGSVRDTLRRTRLENQARLQVDTGEAIDAAMQTECMRRYSDTVDRLVPLLRTLAHGGPVTDELRRRSRAECRRLRTLFDESAPAPTPLALRIQSLIERAEERGVTVTAHVDGDLPQLPLASALDVLGQVDAALTHAHTWARVCLTTAQTRVELSVVCDVDGEPGTETRSPSGGSDVVLNEDTMWVTLRAG